MSHTHATPPLSPVKQALLEIRRLREQLAARDAAAREPIAVVGLSFRFPGVESDPAALHESLCRSLDAIGEIPCTRWDVERHYAPGEPTPGRMYVRRGGFLPDVAGFDPEFFGIAPLEAASIDPQQRLLLEFTWEALENAGIPPTELRGTRSGVFAGMAGNDYARLSLNDPEQVSAYASTGTAFSVASGRIAYLLGLQGPAITLDTACSSSLVAVHLACQSLRQGESDLALAAGVNLILSPELTINFCQAGMLSRDGHCKTFDAAADGYVRSEGCGVVVLKRLSDAQRAGDRILALIRGSAVNQDGRSSGLTAPNGPAQEAVLRAALTQAGLSPAEVGYLEAHGTGTSLGDPIEMQAIGSVYGAAPREEPLWVGSLKTNLGHLEAAAGVAGLIKCVLALQAKEIPPHLHFRTPSPHIPWERLPVAIPTTRVPFPESGGKRRAGVSSFGFSGTNAHVILEEAPDVAVSQEEKQQDRSLHLLTLSAPQESALRLLATRYVEHLETCTDSFADLCHTAAVGRAHFAHRLALTASTAEEARETLQSWLEGDYTPRLRSGSARTDGPRRFVKITSGDAPARRADTADSDEETLWLDAPAAGESWNALLEELARLYVAGAEIDWRGLDRGRVRRRVSLPTYPFQRRRFWLEEARSPAPPPAPPAPPPDPATAWHRTTQAALERAELAPLDLNLATYPAKWDALAELTREVGRNTLASLGAFPAAGTECDVAAVLAATGIRAIYTPVVRRWLEALAEVGALERTEGGYRAAAPLAAADLTPLWRRVETLLADNRPLYNYLAHAAELVPEVITGRTSPLETLFPGGTFELAGELYESSTVLRYVNGIATAALAAHVAALPADAAVRVLEVGAGTGGTTGALLPVLPPERTCYSFTDASPFFFEHAAEKFAAYPFVEPRLFDLEQDAEAQGFAADTFEVIVGSNVVHAVRDLRATLERLRALLAPGGLLLLVESTGHLAWHDVSTGLIEGWQHFEDDLRQDTPLLAAERWTEVLKECGFEEAFASPAPDSPAGVLRQHVLLARAPGVAAAVRAEPAAEPAAAKQTSAATAESTEAAAPAEGPSFAEELAGVPEAEREEMATRVVRECVMEILRSDPSRPPGRDARLMELGLDSLMAVRFRNLLQKRLRLKAPLPSTLVFDYPTIRRIARLVLSLVPEAAAGANADAPDEAARAGIPPADREVEIAALSDEAVERLLLQRLEAEEPR